MLPWVLLTLGWGAQPGSCPAPCQGTHLGGLHFVATTAAPAREVRQDLALLPIEARLHLAPPLLQHDGGWGREQEGLSPQVGIGGAPMGSLAELMRAVTLPRSSSSPAWPHLTQLHHKPPLFSQDPSCKAE